MFWVNPLASWQPQFVLALEAACKTSRVKRLQRTYLLHTSYHIEDRIVGGSSGKSGLRLASGVVCHWFGTAFCSHNQNNNNNNWTILIALGKAALNAHNQSHWCNSMPLLWWWRWRWRQRWQLPPTMRTQRHREKERAAAQSVANNVKNNSIEVSSPQPSQYIIG